MSVSSFVYCIQKFNKKDRANAYVTDRVAPYSPGLGQSYSRLKACFLSIGSNLSAHMLTKMNL